MINKKKIMSQPKNQLLLGAHMSTAGGLEKAIVRGNALGCSTIQLFTTNNRQWSFKSISEEQKQLFLKTFDESSIQTIVSHASYLINLGSPKKEVIQKSLHALSAEIKRCELLTIPYLVLHPGSRLTSTENQCLTQIASNLDKVLEESAGNVMILLETMAGQGSSVCHSFEQLAEIRQLSRNAHLIGICFDTCHTFAAGYHFQDNQSYKELWKTFDKTIGLEHLKVMHINDSKTDRTSRVDRHAHIGQGKLGLDTFRLLFNDPLFFSVPKILETPKKSPEDDRHNMTKLKNLISEKTKEMLLI